MAWAKLDDSFCDHPKVVAVGNAAAGLFARLMAYCARHLTDGHVPETVALMYAGADGPELLDRLVTAGLVERMACNPVTNRTGYRLPGYLDRNPTADDVRRERSRKAANVAAHRAKKAAASGHGADERRACNPVTNRPSNPATDAAVTTARTRIDLSSLRSERPSLRSGLAGDDAGASPPAPARPTSRPKAPKPDLDPAALNPRARAALEAIAADESLAPICPRPAELARDLEAVAPGVDVALEVRRAGAWLRANPARRKALGGRFLTSWLQRAQERAPAGAVARQPFARPEPPAAQATPRPFAPAPPEARERMARLAAQRGQGAPVAPAPPPSGVQTPERPLRPHHGPANGHPVSPDLALPLRSPAR